MIKPLALHITPVVVRLTAKRLCLIAQGCRAAATLGHGRAAIPYPNGVPSRWMPLVTQPRWGKGGNSGDQTQGSCATLGYETQRPWR